MCWADAGFWMHDPVVVDQIILFLFVWVVAARLKKSRLGLGIRLASLVRSNAEQKKKCFAEKKNLAADKTI